MSLHLQPHKFDLNRIKQGATCILVAKRRSGKSVAIKELIHHFDVNCGIKAGVICSHSEESDPYYSKFFPDTFIFDDCEKMLRKHEKYIALNGKDMDEVENWKWSN